MVVTETREPLKQITEGTEEGPRLRKHNQAINLPGQGQTIGGTLISAFYGDDIGSGLG